MKKIGLGVISLLLLSSFTGYLSLSSFIMPATAQNQGGTDPYAWSMYRGNAQRTGYNSGPAPSSNSTSWIANLDDALPQQVTQAGLYSKLVWVNIPTITVNGGRAFVALNGGYVYNGSTSQPDVRSKLLMLDINSGRVVRTLWNSSEFIYPVGFGSKALIVFLVATGSFNPFGSQPWSGPYVLGILAFDSAGNFLWNRFFPGSGDVLALNFAMLYQGKIIVEAASESSVFLNAYDESTGGLVWSSTLGQGFALQLVASKNYIITPFAAYDVNTGKPVWQNSARSLFKMATDNSIIASFLSFIAYNVTDVNTGTILRSGVVSQPPFSTVLQQPTLIQGRVTYIVSQTYPTTFPYSLLSLDYSTGTYSGRLLNLPQSYNYTTGESGGTDGVSLVGDTAVGAGGSVFWSDGWRIFSTDSGTGSAKWQYKLPSQDPSVATDSKATLAVGDGVLVAAVSYFYLTGGPEYGFRAVDRALLNKNLNVPIRVYAFGTPTIATTTTTSSAITSSSTTSSTTADSIINRIAVGSLPIGIAVNPTTNTVYVSNADSDSVSVIDGLKDAVVANIKVGTGPHGIAVNPNSNKIYVTQQTGILTLRSNHVFVIEGSRNIWTANITVGDIPWGVAANPNTNKIYVANWKNDSVSVIDGASNQVVKTIGVGSGPRSVAVNPSTNRIYVVAGSGLYVIDGGSDTVIASVRMGESGANDVAVNVNANRVYVSCCGGTSLGIEELDGATNSVISTFLSPSVSAPEYIAVNPNLNRIYAAIQEENAIIILDTNTRAVLGNISSNGRIFGMAVNPNTNKVYAVNGDSDSVLVLGTMTTTTTTTPSSTTTQQTTTATLPQLKLFSIDSVTFQTGPAQLSGSFNPPRISIPSTTVSLLANNLKVGSFTFALQVGITTAKGGEHDNLLGGGTAKTGDYLAVGSVTLGAQVDNLSPFAQTFNFTADLTARGTEYTVDKIMDVALSVADNVLLTFNPQLFCGVLPLNAIFTNSPCGGPMIVTEASPANLLVTSPSGKMIGTSANGQQVNQIANAWYSGANTEPQIVWVQQPEQGSYSVTIVATGSGEVHYGVGTFATTQVISRNYTNTVSQGSVLQASVSISNTTITAQPPVQSQGSVTQQQAAQPLPSTNLILGAVAIVVVLAGTVFALKRKHR